jgi:TorA maturation chaperone TorD
MISTHTTAAPTTADRIDLALCRSVLDSALAVALRPPSVERLSAYLGGAGGGVLAEAAEGLEDAVRIAVDTLHSALLGATLEDLEASYQHLFGHTAHGKVPPYETEWGFQDLFRQSAELADLSGFYAAFGLCLQPSQRERLDHAGVEWEFLSFLACREAGALSSGDEAIAEEVRRAERLFLGAHLGRFARAFAHGLRREADHPFYSALADLCLALLDFECRTLGVAPGPELLTLRSTLEDEVPMACGRSCGAGGCETARDEEPSSETAPWIATPHP